jgi:hypothetical protein
LGRCGRGFSSRDGYVGLADAGAWPRPDLAQAADQLEQLVAAVAVLAGELDERLCAGDDGAALGTAEHRHSAAAAELEEALVAEGAKGAKHCVRVHAEHRGEVFGRRATLARLGLALGDRAPDLGGCLLESGVWLR